jgi:hypothetical protein
MEITFVWSWLSFIAGAVSVFVGGFVLLLLVAIGQWKKQRKAAAAQQDSVEKLFSAWGGRDNSPL